MTRLDPPSDSKAPYQYPARPIPLPLPYKERGDIPRGIASPSVTAPAFFRMVDSPSCLACHTAGTADRDASNRCPIQVQAISCQRVHLSVRQNKIFLEGAKTAWLSRFPGIR